MQSTSTATSAEGGVPDEVVRLRRWARVVLVPVGLIGVALSFASIYEAALPSYGPVLAAGFPFLVDFLILGASLQYLAGAKVGRPRAGWRLTAHAGVAGTLALNAMAAEDLAHVPWHVVAPAVWSVLVEMTAREVLGEWKATHRAPADRIPARLWLTAPVESARTWLLMARTGAPAHGTARVQVGVMAAASEALRLALPGRRPRRVRRIIRRQLRAGSLPPSDVLASLGWTDDSSTFETDPAVVLRATLRGVLSPGGSAGTTTATAATAPGTAAGTAVAADAAVGAAAAAAVGVRAQPAAPSANGSSVTLHPLNGHVLVLPGARSGSKTQVDGSAPHVDRVASTDGSAPHLNGAAPHLNGAAPHLNGAAPHLNGATPHANGGAPHLDGVASHLDGGAAVNGAAPHVHGGPVPVNSVAPQLNGAGRRPDGGTATGQAGPRGGRPEAPGQGSSRSAAATLQVGVLPAPAPEEDDLFSSALDAPRRPFNDPIFLAPAPVAQARDAEAVGPGSGHATTGDRPSDAVALLRANPALTAPELAVQLRALGWVLSDRTATRVLGEARHYLGTGRSGSPQ